MHTRVLALLTAVIVVSVVSGCSPATPAGPVTPTVTSAAVESGYLTASGTVSGVAESGGTCKFTFWSKSGGGASRLTSSGAAAGDHTDCGEDSEQATMLLPGEYEVDLTYESLDGETSVGERVPVTVTR